MKNNKKIEVPIKEVICNIEVEVMVVGTKIASFRLKLASWFIRLASKIGGFKSLDMFIRHGDEPTGLPIVNVITMNCLNNRGEKGVAKEISDRLITYLNRQQEHGVSPEAKWSVTFKRIKE